MQATYFLRERLLVERDLLLAEREPERPAPERLDALRDDDRLDDDRLDDPPVDRLPEVARFARVLVPLALRLVRVLALFVAPFARDVAPLARLPAALARRLVVPLALLARLRAPVAVLFALLRALLAVPLARLRAPLAVLFALLLARLVRRPALSASALTRPVAAFAAAPTALPADLAARFAVGAAVDRFRPDAAAFTAVRAWRTAVFPLFAAALPWRVLAAFLPAVER